MPTRLETTMLAPDPGSGLAPTRAASGGPVQSAIDGLPGVYRSVFILRAAEGLSVADTASCLGVGSDVVETRWLRARALLRDALAARIEALLPQVFAFAGARCDAVVAHVLAELERRGRIRRDVPS